MPSCKLTVEEAQRAAELVLIASTAERDLHDYLVGLGYETKRSQRAILQKIRAGWRPVRLAAEQAKEIRAPGPA